MSNPMKMLDRVRAQMMSRRFKPYKNKIFKGLAPTHVQSYCLHCWLGGQPNQLITMSHTWQICKWLRSIEVDIGVHVLRLFLPKPEYFENTLNVTSSPNSTRWWKSKKHRSIHSSKLIKIEICQAEVSWVDLDSNWRVRHMNLSKMALMYTWSCQQRCRHFHSVLLELKVNPNIFSLALAKPLRGHQGPDLVTAQSLAICQRLFG